MIIVATCLLLPGTLGTGGDQMRRAQEKCFRVRDQLSILIWGACMVVYNY